MTCRPQLRGTGIFKPRVKLQNNKQKVRLSNSGSGGANPKERPVKAKGLEKLEMWPWCRHPQCSLLTEGTCLNYQWPLQAWKPWKWRERACKQENCWEGKRLRCEEGRKQKVRREPEPWLGQGSRAKSGEENKTSDTLTAKGNHSPSLLHLQIKQQN